jgi:hypothetical protein
MCGICGVYSLNFQSNDLKLFKQLLYLNEIRGRDSTGIIRMNKGGDRKTDWYKAAIAPSDFLRNPDAQKAMRSDKVYGYIGHARAGTIGKVSEENAHPFDFAKVVGVHNGTVHKMFKHDRDYDTDSEAIYRCINDMGLKDALEEFSGKTSAYTLNWVDKEAGTINWISNGRRPIAFCYVYGRNTLLWSSMQETLDMVVAYNGLTASGWLEEDKAGNERFFTIDTHDLLSIKLGDHPNSVQGIDHIDVDPDKQTASTSVVWSSDNGWNHGHSSRTSANYWLGEDSYESFWEDLTDDELDENGKVRKNKQPFRPTEWVEINGFWCKVVKGTKEVVEQYPSGAKPGTSGAKPPEKEDSSPFDDAAVPNFLLVGPPGVKTGKKATTFVNSIGEVIRPTNPPKYHFEPPVSPSEISYRLAQGCMVCSTKYKLEEYSLVQEDAKKTFKFAWWSREAFCCPDCMSEQSVRRAYFDMAGEGE